MNTVYSKYLFTYTHQKIPKIFKFIFKLDNFDTKQFYLKIKCTIF